MERQQERFKLDLCMTSLMGDWKEQKTVGFEVRWTQVQTLVLSLRSYWVTWDKLFQISLSLSFLPQEQVLRFLPRAMGRSM